MQKASFFYILILTVCGAVQSCTPASSVGKDQTNSLLVAVGGDICQQNSGLMWTVEKSSTFQTLAEAKEYTTSLRVGEYADWRLPTKEELYYLCYIYEMNLAGDCPIPKPKGNYWSQNGTDQAGEWHVYPLCAGPEFKYIKSHKGRARAVRP